MINLNNPNCRPRELMAAYIDPICGNSRVMGFQTQIDRCWVRLVSTRSSVHNDERTKYCVLEPQTLINHGDELLGHLQLEAKRFRAEDFFRARHQEINVDLISFVFSDWFVHWRRPGIRRGRLLDLGLSRHRGDDADRASDRRTSLSITLDPSTRPDRFYIASPCTQTWGQRSELHFTREMNMSKPFKMSVQELVCTWPDRNLHGDQARRKESYQLNQATRWVNTANLISMSLRHIEHRAKLEVIKQLGDLEEVWKGTCNLREDVNTTRLDKVSSKSDPG
ncbi:hypothetical protein C8R47DRAFT_1064366 [Mycena vitilis]|nr:hypothetical protein C8R47DRAFT_1064366 [Mycena vitilis]